ncbi:MAG: hypothetical protein LBH25_09985 [Fibromonadaceae bacterium]|nr:hypothetical protein [Fibromonadaceae bacterium]
MAKLSETEFANRHSNDRDLMQEYLCLVEQENGGHNTVNKVIGNTVKKRYGLTNADYRNNEPLSTLMQNVSMMGIIIICLWWLIDLFPIASGNFKDDTGKKVRNTKKQQNGDMLSKAASGWNRTNGEDTYGFAALPGGVGDPV